MISIITPALIKSEQSAQWLHEAIASVHDQNYPDWEMIVVDDHSPTDLSAVKAAWPRVQWLNAEGQGVSLARNQAAQAAHGDLLLPLDADDKLAPTALAMFAAAWQKRGDAGILYSDVVMFGQDYARVYLAAEYDFRKLLHATYMTVGCLHRKSDWQRIGGWRADMTQGLEDWEYWIALGEVGVCGQRVAEPLYWYRRHPTGRLAWLKANKELWNKAYAAMRDAHRDSYNGRFTAMCCGGKNTLKAAAPAKAASRAVPAGSDGLVQMVYRGNRKGDFMITSGVTRTLYRVPGKGEFVEQPGKGAKGVNPADVPWFRSIAQGQEFQVVVPPAPAPVAPVVTSPLSTVNPDSEAWTPATMEAIPAPPLDSEGTRSAPVETKEVPVVRRRRSR